MDKVKINICVRPYYHDVVETIERKPRFNKNNNKHYVTYKKQTHELKRGAGDVAYVIWIDEDDREK